MINHARTLLLNVSAHRTHLQDAGYEYISPAYKPIALDGVLATINNVLFGSKPDHRFLNLRAAELLSYMHQTELSQYVYALDARVTYWPRTVAQFQPTRPVRVTQFSGSRRQLTAAGSFNATNAAPVAQRQYFVALTTGDQTTSLTNALLTEASDFLNAEDAGSVLLQELATTGDSNAASDVNALYIKQINSLAAPLIVPLTSATDLPSVTLPETQVIVTPASLPPPTTNNSARWLVDLVTDPPPAITTILPALELLGEPAVLELFGVAPTEPYATFKNVWFDHPLPAYRLAGFVLAYIYRINERRSDNNG